MSRQRNPIFQRHRCPRCPRFSDLNFPCEIIQSEQAKGIGQGHVLQCQQGESWALRDESIWNAPSRVRVYGSRCMDLLSTRLTLQRSTPSFSSTAVPARFTLIQSTKYTLKKKDWKMHRQVRQASREMRYITNPPCMSIPNTLGPRP